MTAYCGQCKRDIVGSVSLDFCSQTCQELWQAKLGKPLDPSPIPRPHDITAALINHFLIRS